MLGVNYKLSGRNAKMKSCNRVLINGKVCYRNGNPVKNAIVILEAFLPHSDYKKFCGYTLTNCNGEFCCLIYNKRYYYKLKVFNNECLSNEDCSIYFE
jgi:hypothetical protein